MLQIVTATAFTQMTSYITDRLAEAPDALHRAHVEADENGLRAPSIVVGSLLQTLAGTTGTQGAVAVTPAAGVVGLHLLAGLPEKSTLTCIEPDAALQAGAKDAFKLAGHGASRTRFLTARPLDVMGRLAAQAYQLIYLDVAPRELQAVLELAWPLLSQGGMIVVADSLLDGTLADPSRRDRDTDAARAADDYVETLATDHGALVARLPLDGGLTLITKR